MIYTEPEKEKYLNKKKQLELTEFGKKKSI